MILEDRNTIHNSIIADMSEGVMAVRYDGKIVLVNDAALAILGKEREMLEGQPFAACFFSDERNDGFAETILETIRKKNIRQEAFVAYYTGDTRKDLRVVSSYLHNGEEVVGIILVLSDITELSSLRDAVQAMEKIRSLNSKLEIRNRLLQDTFGRYLSDDIVKEILDTPDGLRLGGQRKVITVLMSDLRGFTMMCERMEAQNLVFMLNHYFSVMYEEISRYSGTIIEFLGDGMFIIFGAPTENRHHASDAVACALAMQKRMQEVNDWNRERGYEPLSMGVGIHTGPVIVGNIGSEKRTKYGVMGQTVNLAGRIEGYTAEAQVLISEGTKKAVKENLRIEDAFTVAFKGVSKEVPVFHVTGIAGNYGIFQDTYTEALKKLPEPFEVTFRKLNEKYICKEKYQGKIIAVSFDQAVLSTDAELEDMNNLVIDIGEDLYGKVLAEEEAGREWKLRITGRPDSFREWIDRVVADGKSSRKTGKETDQGTI